MSSPLVFVVRSREALPSSSQGVCLYGSSSSSYRRDFRRPARRRQRRPRLSLPSFPLHILKFISFFILGILNPDVIWIPLRSLCQKSDVCCQKPSVPLLRPFSPPLKTPIDTFRSLLLCVYFHLCYFRLFSVQKHAVLALKLHMPQNIAAVTQLLNVQNEWRSNFRWRVSCWSSFSLKGCSDSVWTSG